MAYCHGPNSPYGCAHHVQHQEAAKKGWITRRAGTRFAASHEHNAISALFGNEITHAHEHESHKGQIVFKSKGQWYELPKSVFAGFVREGRSLQREQARTVEKQRREDERKEREYQREVARLEKIGQREQAQKAKKRQKEERDRLKYEREREREERRVHASGYAQYQEVVRSIRG
ncbi:MAG TPA: hypothetical protein VH593_02050, partial [Ktedonobacteraceae bacterium]